MTEHRGRRTMIITWKSEFYDDDGNNYCEGHSPIYETTDALETVRQFVLEDMDRKMLHDQLFAIGPPLYFDVISDPETSIGADILDSDEYIGGGTSVIRHRSFIELLRNAREDILWRE